MKNARTVSNYIQILVNVHEEYYRHKHTFEEQEKKGDLCIIRNIKKALN